MAGISSPGPGPLPEPRSKSCWDSVTMLACGTAVAAALVRLVVR